MKNLIQPVHLIFQEDRKTRETEEVRFHQPLCFPLRVAYQKQLVAAIFLQKE